MKKVYFLVVMLFAFAMTNSSIMAQDANTQQLSKKEAKKAEREKRKKIEAAKGQLLFNQAVEALKNNSFLIKVDQLMYPKGRTQFVTAQTNFIYVNDDKAVIQIATSNFAPGPNGVGGITVEGRPSDIKMTTDKKGNIYYEFTDQGIAVSATVNIQLIPGSNKVEATVYPNFNNNNLTLTGTIVPYDSKLIFQGQTI